MDTVVDDSELRRRTLRFAEVADAVGATTKKLEKAALLGAYFAELGDEDLEVYVRRVEELALTPTAPQDVIDDIRPATPSRRSVPTTLRSSAAPAS